MDYKKSTFILKPKLSQYVANNLELLFLNLCFVIAIGVDDKQIGFVCLCLSCLLGLYLLYQLWFFTTVQWTVNNEKIRYSRGVFNRSTDFLELYRVIDYKEQQNFVQQLLNIKTLIIYSGDRSHGILCIYGLSGDNDIVEFIRNSVEYQKKQKRVYEITNS